MNEFKMDILENPEIYQQNRVAAHSDHVCYRDWEEKAAAEGTLPDVLGKRKQFPLLFGWNIQIPLCEKL